MNYKSHTVRSLSAIGGWYVSVWLFAVLAMTAIVATVSYSIHWAGYDPFPSDSQTTGQLLAYALVIVSGVVALAVSLWQYRFAAQIDAMREQQEDVRDMMLKEYARATHHLEEAIRNLREQNNTTDLEDALQELKALTEKRNRLIHENHGRRP